MRERSRSNTPLPLSGKGYTLTYCSCLIRTYAPRALNFDPPTTPPDELGGHVSPQFIGGLGDLYVSPA